MRARSFRTDEPVANIGWLLLVEHLDAQPLRRMVDGELAPKVGQLWVGAHRVADLSGGLLERRVLAPLLLAAQEFGGLRL